MPRRALGRALSVLLTATVAASLGVTVAPAYASDAPAPIVVDDVISVYPGQLRHIDVLANDASPSGDDLALCRLPPPGLDDHAGAVATKAERPGELVVLSAPRAKGTTRIDYFVCDKTHLTPATLTVSIRPVEAVEVQRVDGRPGLLAVTNHNDKAVRFWFGSPRGSRPDGRVDVPAGATEVVTVRRHRVGWIAFIGGTGVADRGRVTNIGLATPALPAPRHGGGPTGWYFNRVVDAMLDTVLTPSPAVGLSFLRR